MTSNYFFHRFLCEVSCGKAILLKIFIFPFFCLPFLDNFYRITFLNCNQKIVEKSLCFNGNFGISLLKLEFSVKSLFFSYFSFILLQMISLGFVSSFINERLSLMMSSRFITFCHFCAFFTAQLFEFVCVIIRITGVHLCRRLTF